MIGYQMLASRADHFWSKVDSTDVHSCWPWKQGRSGRGYGQYHLGPKVTGLGRWCTIGAHRVAWMLHHQRDLPPLSSGMVVDHRCERPACCNPAHLVLVSSSSNLRASSTRAIEVLPSGRFKVRFRANGKQTSRTFDLRDDAVAFEKTLRTDTVPRIRSAR